MPVTASVTLSQIIPIMNRNYSEQQAADATIHRNEIMRRIKKGAGSNLMESFDVRALDFVMRVRKSDAGGFGGISSTGALPTATSSDFVNISVKPCYHSAQVTCDLRALLLNGTDRTKTMYAFASQLQADMEGIFRQKRDYDEINLFAATEGVLSTIAAGSTSTYDGSAYTAITNVPTLQHLPIGARIDIYNAAKTSKRGSYTVKKRSATYGTGTLYVNGDASGAGIIATDVILREHIVGNTNGELIGLPQAIAATGNYPSANHSNDYLNRSTDGNEFWRSIMLDATNFAHPEDAFIYFMDLMMNYGWNEVPEGRDDRSQFIAVNHRLKTALNLDSRQFMQWNLNEGSGKVPDIGVNRKDAFYNGFPVIGAARCPVSDAYFVDPQTWAYGAAAEGKLVQAMIGGGASMTLDPGTINATLGYLWCNQMFCKNPGQNGRIYNIDVPDPLAA